MRTSIQSILVMLIFGMSLATHVQAKGDPKALFDGSAIMASASERASDTLIDVAEESQGCPTFLNGNWTLYANGDADLWVAWDVVPGMTGDMIISMMPSGGETFVVSSALGFVAIDVLESEIDPFPQGYALAPGPVGTYRIQADVQINGEHCVNVALLGALPPPTSLSLKSHGPAVEQGGYYALEFNQKYPLTVANTILYYMPSPRSFENFFGTQFWFGSTAKVGTDFNGPASNPYSGTTLTYPAHVQSQSMLLEMIDDECPEPTENVITYWVYEQDANWISGNVTWAILGAPSFTFDILDDDQLNPPCFVEYVTEKD